MMYNLLAEAARKGVTKKQMSECIDVSEKTFYNKIRGLTEITLIEAQMIRDSYFPDFKIEYLFEQKED